MRKTVILFLIFITLTLAAPAYAYTLGTDGALPALISDTPAVPEVETASVKINGVSPLFTHAPFLANGSTLVPVRAVMEHLGCKVGWEDATQAVTITTVGKNISLAIGSDEIKVNGTVKKIPAPALLIGDVTYVPIRAVSEALGATVGWDDAARTAGIYTYEKNHTLTVGAHTLAIGQTFDSFTAANGFPTYSVPGENGLTWHVYAASPDSFFTVGTDGGILCAYYTNTPGFATAEGLNYGLTAPEDGKQYEFVRSGHVGFHKYYDVNQKILCAVYAIADGYYNPHDIGAALNGQARIGLDILNTFRYANHLSPLVWDDAAAVCSADHARYMASVGELTHTGSDGSNAIERYLLYNPGFRWSSWGENICAGAKNIFTCMNGWRNSVQHRAIMLSDKTCAGIGFIHDPQGKYAYSAAMLLLR